MKESNIEVQSNMGDFVMFRTSCTCSNDGHNLDVIVDYGTSTENQPEISLFFHTVKLESYNDAWYRRAWTRIKRACTILWTGDIELEDYFTFRGESHARDFINTLQEALDQVITLKRKAAEEIEERCTPLYICPKCGSSKKFSISVYGEADIDRYGNLTNINAGPQGRDALVRCRECDYCAPGYQFEPKR